MIITEELCTWTERIENIIKKNYQDDQVFLKKDIFEIAHELLANPQGDLLKNGDEAAEFYKQYIDLYNLAPIGYFTLDQNGLIIQVNPAGEELLGLEKNSLYKKSFSRYISPESQSVFSQYKRNILEQIPTPPCEIKLFKKKQALFYAQLKAQVRINPKTKQEELLLMLTDITHQKKIEDCIYQQQQKMAAIDRINSMGELASTMAHELNHPISVISNYIHGCIHRLENGDNQLEALLHTMHKAMKEVHRASEILLRMRNFVCNGTLNYEPTNIDSIIKETINLINYEIQDTNISIHYRPTSASLPNVMLDRIHIQQVILNLARNAIEAMRDNSTAEPKLIIEVNQIKKDIIEINVLDNGPGFSPRNVHKLFEPNFTTKPYGIGLGLAVSNTIIESHGGKLYAELNPTRGACFKIKLPIKVQNSEMYKELYS